MTHTADPRFRAAALPAGLLYLGIILLGISAEAALRGPLIDWSSDTATAQAIAANLGQFRLSILFDLTMAAFDIALAVMFFTMLRPVGDTLALAAMVFRLMQAAIIGGNVLALWAASTATTPLPDLARHAAGYDLGLFFFAINSALMAVLLLRAGAPRLIGLGIGAAGLVYMAGSLTRFLAPALNATMQPAYLVPVVAETALMVWLLTRGLRRG